MANNNDKFISRENAKTLWGYMIDLLTGKQNKLTFDETPTQSSDNPVKSGGIFTALAGKGTYSKPQNGIPKTDLENAVQTSLGLADSALQSETDPTVPSWAKATNKPSYTQDEVGDGSTYKRVSQTEKDTWNGKQNAINDLSTIRSGAAKGATAVQPAELNNYAPNSSLVDTINNGAKNLLHFDGLSSATSYGVSFTINGDYSVTATRVSSSTTTASVDLTLNGNKVYLDDWCDGEHYLSGCPANGSGTTYEIIAQTDGTTDYIKRDYGNGILLDAKAVSDTNIVFRLIVRAEFTGTITFKPMISTKSQFGISDKYEPYALGNQYLTPALIEQVDSGAKQLIPYDLSILKSNNTLGSWSNNVYTYNSVTFTVNSDDSISVNRSATGASGVSFRLATNAAFSAGTYVFSAGSGTLPQDWTLSIDWSDGTHTYATNATNPVTFTLTTAKTGNIYIWVSTPSGSFTYKPMICTLADWNVSHKHVPYRPNWDLVGMLVPKTSYYTTNFSAANTWTYSNLSFTVPAGQIYILIASMSWNSGKPAGICISTSPTPTGLIDADIVAINETAANAITCMLQMPADVSVDKTFYCHVKNESASGSSPTRLTAIRIK